MSYSIKVENLSKQYRLGLIGTGTLSHDLQRKWALIRGQEDPYLKIGDKNDRSKKGSSDYVWALKDINFEVKPGEILGIIGKNGAGKSTLLKILSRVTGPTTGSIKYKGRIGSLLEVGTGFHQELTGRENIYLNGAILGMRKSEITRKLDEIIDFSGVERYIDTPVKRYSSGMMVRLGFAVAAFLEPEILIIDEVLAVGDAEFHKRAIEKIKDVSNKDGRTVLFVSHNMNSIKSLCTKGMLLLNGNVKYAGCPRDIIDKYFNQFISEDKSNSKIVSDCGRVILETPYWIDDNSQCVKYYNFSEKIVLRFRLELLETFKYMTFGMAIESLYGERILTAHSDFDNKFIIKKTLLGKIIVDCKIDLKIIAPGNYNVLFGIRDQNGKNIIKSVEPIKLRIEATNLSDDGIGLLKHSGSWEIEYE